MNLIKSKTAKIFAGFVGLTIAFVLFATPVAKTQALTNDQLTAQINALLATIAGLQAQIGGGSSSSGSSSGYVYNNDLTIGSTGPDVSALQATLSEHGFLTMPAGVPMGYFGSLTAAAVKAWQASVGLPATGYFGPLSRAKMNAMVVVVPPPTNGGGTTLPAGCTSTSGYSSTTGQPCSGGSTGPVMDGTDGSVTLSYVSYAPASQTLKKGDMNKPVISVKLQAVNGQVTVTRLDVHFSERPWLDFGSLSLTDGTGAVLATKTLTGPSDVTEVTVGTDYLVRFDNLNIPVTPGTDKILAVAVNVLAASDKITGQTVYVGIPSGSIRTINGKGYTDSVGLSSGQGSAATSASGNAVTLSSTGSTATAYTRIDPSSPATTRTVVTSSNNTTPNVTLGVFGIKLQNQSGTLNSLSFNINRSTSAGTTTLLSNLRVQIGGQTYGANSLAGGISTFTNMSVPLAQDAWVPVTLLADINSNQTSISASSTLVAASIGGVDANFNTISTSQAANVTSADTNFSLSGVNVVPGVANTTNCGNDFGQQGNTITSCLMTMSFTVTNVGNTDIYISKTPAVALSTTTLVGGVATAVSSSTLSAYQGVQTGTGDTLTSYDVQSGGTRTFTVTGRFSRPAGLSLEQFKITAIKFGTSTTDGTADASLNAQTTTAGTNSASLVNYGLEPLVITY
jgi:peptidoglycan hydrolase-like protein with peptidoglycan-binding domain